MGAVNGVMNAIDQAEKETATTRKRSRRGFNSRRGIKAMYLVRLIKGFVRTISRTIYSSSNLTMSKTILYTLSKKKIQAFSSTQISTIKTLKTTLKTVVKVKIEKHITIVRDDMTKQNMKPM